jgi:hypothetical protein
VRKFVLLCKQNGWDQIIVVTGPDYSWRVLRDLKKALEEINYSAVILKAELLDKEDPDLWYLGSEQWWTRSRNIFRAYEFFIRCLSFETYKKKATRAE